MHPPIVIEGLIFRQRPRGTKQRLLIILRVDAVNTPNCPNSTTTSRTVQLTEASRLGRNDIEHRVRGTVTAVKPRIARK